MSTAARTTDPPHHDARAARARGIGPTHVALALLLATLLPLLTGPLRDIDLYWHVRIGRQIITQHSLDHLGTSWLGEPAHAWQTSQWLSEVVLAALVDLGGWRAVLLTRLLLLTALLAILARLLLRHRHALPAAPVLLLAAVGVGAGVQARPQTFSLVFLALLGASCVRLWTGGRRPSLLLVAAGSLLWAQLHGLWILVPAAYAVTAAGLALDGPRTHLPQLRHALLAAGASLTGILNPLGPESFVLPLRLERSTAVIAEWQPTDLTQVHSVCWMLLLLLVAAAWARSAARVPMVELLWVGTWTVFGFLAFRNVIPSLLLIAPVAAVALDRTWGARAERFTRPPSPREARLLASAAVAAVVAGLGAATVTATSIDPLADAPARHIAGRLSREPHPVRVFNAYNTSGSLIVFGGDKVRLVVDGRADLWGEAHIRKLTDAGALKPGWRATFDGFRPDAAVLPDDAALTTMLLAEGTWQVAMRDGSYVLLLPTGRTGPGTTGPPSPARFPAP